MHTNWYVGGKQKHPPILQQEKLEDAKDKIQQATGLRLTNGKLLTGIKALGVPPRLKDYMRNMPMSRIKCGLYIPDHAERALCASCRKEEAIKTLKPNSTYGWKHNSQDAAWATAKKLWEKRRQQRDRGQTCHSD